MVALNTANCITLGQVVADAMSNEITAIPRLLEILDVSVCLVTIDAMGCQTDIAADIVAEADYVLAVKDNQPTLSAGILREFSTATWEERFCPHESRHQTDEKDTAASCVRTMCGVPDDGLGRRRWTLPGHCYRPPTAAAQWQGAGRRYQHL